jgi:glycosyltransferase involved in cell wall biosynthesis
LKILIVSDAWFPQVNGVVRTLSTVKKELEAVNHQVRMITPDQFKSIPCPTYREIRLATNAGPLLPRMIDEFEPSAIHIATEGPLGFLARRYCLKRGYPFTTSFHTRFPEYLQMRFAIPPSIVYRFLRWFHAPASKTLTTPPMIEELKSRGFGRLAAWSRGVDTALFRPRPQEFLNEARPVFLYIGRVAVEKNIEAFLRLNLPGSKVVVGDGPQLEHLKRTFPEVRFVGDKQGEELARYYAAGDVFVFPSRTDTFGLVLLEALSSGVPVAAFPVCGPLQVLNGSGTGVMDEDLGKAALQALSIPREKCRDYALQYSWAACADQFLSNLHPFR